MLDVETNHQIILLYFKEGLSQRKIAKQLKISRVTVKARVAEYERFKSQPASASPVATCATNKYLTHGPAYDSSNRTKRKLKHMVYFWIKNKYILARKTPANSWLIKITPLVKLELRERIKNSYKTTSMVRPY